AEEGEGACACLTRALPTTTSTTSTQPTGCAASSRPATLRPAMSMKGASKMSDRATCADTSSATSSPGSESGPTHCVEQDGPTIDLFGPVPVRANLSARQAKGLGLMTSGTYGLHGSTSSRAQSLVLSRSLANRLRATTDLLGSTLYRLTWKE